MLMQQNIIYVSERMNQLYNLIQNNLQDIVKCLFKWNAFLISFVRKMHMYVHVYA